MATPPQHTNTPHTQTYPPTKTNTRTQIHDQGAGGNCNVVKEIIYPLGAKIDVRAVKVGDETLSVLEIWGAEYQVRAGGGRCGSGCGSGCCVGWIWDLGGAGVVLGWCWGGAGVVLGCGLLGLVSGVGRTWWSVLSHPDPPRRCLHLHLHLPRDLDLAPCPAVCVSGY